MKGDLRGQLFTRVQRKYNHSFRTDRYIETKVEPTERVPTPSEETLLSVVGTVVATVTGSGRRGRPE